MTHLTRDVAEREAAAEIVDAIEGSGTGTFLDRSLGVLHKVALDTEHSFQVYPTMSRSGLGLMAVSMERPEVRVSITKNINAADLALLVDTGRVVLMGTTPQDFARFPMIEDIKRVPVAVCALIAALATAGALWGSATANISDAGPSLDHPMQTLPTLIGMVSAGGIAVFTLFEGLRLEQRMEAVRRGTPPVGGVGGSVIFLRWCIWSLTLCVAAYLLFWCSLGFDLNAASFEELSVAVVAKASLWAAARLSMIFAVVACVPVLHDLVKFLVGEHLNLIMATAVRTMVSRSHGKNVVVHPRVAGAQQERAEDRPDRGT